MNRTGNELADYVWNPVTGCLKNCRFCYARLNALRFAGDYRRNLTDPRVRRVGKDLVVLDSAWMVGNNHLNTPTGFVPTLHRYRLDYPKKIKTGSTIMVCMDGDLFGSWVPEEWIREVFKAADEAPQHNYLFLTQFPERYNHLAVYGALPKKPNFWYGTTATDINCGVWTKEGYNAFVAIEPILSPFPGNRKEVIEKLKWIVIGAETGRSPGRVVPKAEWIRDILRVTDITDTPVFMRSSMKNIVGVDGMRREKPAEFYAEKDPTPAQKARSWGHCAECDKYRPMKEMYAVLLRKKRGDSPKAVAYMCPECYEEFSAERNWNHEI